MDLPFLMTSIIVSVAASLLGVFIIVRRMALVSDVLSHVALPGIALAFLIGINPFIGAFAALAVVTVGIFFLERKFAVSIDALVGVAFTLALAFGMILTPEAELGEALFGDIASVTKTDLVVAASLGLFLVGFLLVLFRRLAHATFSKEFSLEETKTDVIMEFLFLVAVALAIALGIKVVGTLLMGAMLILPALAAKNIGRSLKSMTVVSVMLGIIAMMGGLYLSEMLSLVPGAAIIIIGGAFFVISLGARSLMQRTV
ncbi:hypothetical protein A2Z10_02225 [Candidatus Azambacteria bacterium RBG_16_47_10]|uniref:ABC transporter n=1 Tax=Candidatus Azambacteria bacterium RBG_16_47_10 TaxID=1797292 RepID=A0A1F5AYA2_9BACT|nr:MAG: hypothetical protein A2Z10_02225 [Candidatus Azambacteria bacterium RBG_16_47_10]